MQPKPQGFLLDLKVRIGGCLVETDFHVVNMSDGDRVLLATEIVKVYHKELLSDLDVL